MNLLNKLTHKNLKLNKKRTIVTIIGIILSVALIMAVSTMYSSMIASLIKFEITEKGNFHVVFSGVPTADVTTFKNNREIDKIYLTQNLGYAKINSINPNKPYIFVKGFTSDALNNLAINLVKGRMPKEEDEILIPTHLKTNGGVEYNIGDTIKLDLGLRVNSEGNVLTQNDPYIVTDDHTFSEQIVKTTLKTYKIVGIIERPANTIEDYSAPGYTLITYSRAPLKDGLVDVYTHLTPKGIKNYPAIIGGILNIDADKLKAYLEGGKLSEEEALNVYEKITTSYQFKLNGYLIDLEANPFQNSTIGSLGNVVLIVCGIIVFTSIFCIKNSFDISITEKTKQYGMLRSLGATKKQIRHNVFYEASILGLIGIPLGIIYGLFAAFILVIICNYFLVGAIADDLNLIFAVKWWSFIIAIILGALTIYFSAFRSAQKAAKVSPIESIRNSANIKIKKIKNNKLISRLFGIGGDISYKNLKRNKKKYRTTVISIVVSVAIFIALSSFMSMAFDTVKLEIGEHDYNLELRVNLNNITNSQLSELNNMDNVKNLTMERDDSIYLTNPKYNQQYIEKMGIDESDSDMVDGYMMIISVGPKEYQTYLKKLGLKYEEVKDKGILLDTVLFATTDGAETHNYQLRQFAYAKNDRVEFSLAGKKYNIEIAAVTEKRPFAITQNIGSSMLIVSDEYFTAHSNQDYASFYYNSKDVTKLQDSINRLLKDKEYNLNNVEENANMMNNLFTLIGIFLYGFIIVISLIGITNIFNTITTNMELRKPEFAMLKSIGMTKVEFNRMIRLESIFMGLKSLIIGIPLGILLSVLIYYAFNVPYSYKLPIMAIIITIVAVYFLITLIMHYSIKKINKQNTIETIRNENI